ncbi:hypothetical protein [Lonepinella koalarum]|uniref:Tetratricopeptide repeat protein n=1 Tax=Lonepinella koalarum TaxID=53417 RepID=A0A4R1KJL6_9PAST|nr:hypothetical protein [Lonepinella koalarum]MDH2927346.1 hypothetical protein [Lonepinella koalarum]TCK64922.1 hypothetical protein EV692_2407 [Lonepinella koalarum]TFJ88819.1 hypothetical protein E0709_11860 [Lonepinella koalarum]
MTNFFKSNKEYKLNKKALQRAKPHSTYMPKLVYIARRLWSKGDYEAALTCLYRVRQTFVNNPKLRDDFELTLYFPWCLYKLGRFEEAQTEFKILYDAIEQKFNQDYLYYGNYYSRFYRYTFIPSRANQKHKLLVSLFRQAAALYHLVHQHKQRDFFISQYADYSFKLKRYQRRWQERRTGMPSKDNPDIAFFEIPYFSF